MPSLKNFNPPAYEAVDVEIWRNDARGGTAVLKLDPLGNVRGERVAPGGTTSVTPFERRLNHDRAATPDQDPFLNGRLTPVRLLDSEEDTPILKANPNNLTEEDIKGLTKLSVDKLTDRLNQITNPIVLERTKAVFEEQNATVKQLQAIEARLEAVSEKPRRVPTLKDVTEEPEVKASRRRTGVPTAEGESLAE